MDQITAVRERTFTWEDPMISAAIGMKLSGLEFLQKMVNGDLPPPPIAQMIGMQLISVEAGKAVFGLQPAEYHYNPIGVVHGGVASTLLDSALGCCIQSMLPMGTAYTTVELHVNLVRPLTRDTGYVRSEGEVIHVGRSMATAHARLTDEKGKLYAHGTTTCFVFTPGESKGG